MLYTFHVHFIEYALRQIFLIIQQIFVLNNPRLTVDMQPNGIVKKINNQQADMGVFENIAQISKHAITASFGVDNVFFVEYADKTGRT